MSGRSKSYARGLGRGSTDDFADEAGRGRGRSRGRGFSRGRGREQEAQPELTAPPPVAGNLKRKQAPGVPKQPTTAGGLVLAQPGFTITFNPIPRRTKVLYYVDFNGLTTISKDVWRTWSVRRNNATVIRDFSESMFIDAITSMAFKMLCLSALRNDALPDFYKKAWFLDQMEALNDRIVPKFLLAWFEGLGSFTGPDGSRFVASVPEPDFHDGLGDVDARYASSFPNFVLLRQIIENERLVRIWHHIRADGAGPVQPSELSELEVRSMPGHYRAPIGMTPYVRGNLANLSARLLDPGADNRTLDYFVQRREEFESLSHQIIKRICEGDARDTIPSGPFKCPSGEHAGNAAPAYIVRPDPSLADNQRVDSVYLTFAGASPDITAATYARIFQYSIVKRPNPADGTIINVRDPAELVDRYDHRLTPITQTTPTFNYVTLLEAYLREFFATVAE